MHNAQSSQWDSGLLNGTMEAIPREEIIQVGQIETFSFSRHQGVDAVHAWYFQLEELCDYKQPCYQQARSKHLGEAVWDSVNRAGYLPTKGDANGLKTATPLRLGLCGGTEQDLRTSRPHGIRPPVK